MPVVDYFLLFRDGVFGGLLVGLLAGCSAWGIYLGLRLFQVVIK